MSDSGHTGSPEAGEVDRGNRPIWPRGTLTAVILGGGVADNRRLFPLTQHRTLPALPFGGAYRCADGGASVHAIGRLACAPFALSILAQYLLLRYWCC